MARARELGARLAVLPEMALVGYCPRDLLFRRRFVEAAEDALRDLAADSHGICIVVGTVGVNGAGGGRPFANLAVVLDDGREIARIQKTLLPAYDVFDEARYFEPGEPGAPVVVDGRRVGVMVCEDLWSRPVDYEATGYRSDPASVLVRQGAEILVNISASPFHRGKARMREDLVRATARALQRPLVLTNLVGGNDDVLFDGRSLVADSAGALMYRAPAYRGSVDVVDLDGTQREDERLPVAEDPADLYAALVMGVRDYAAKCGFKSAHLGLSGGIDSTLVAIIAADAFGASAVRGLAMPSRFSSEGSVADALELARRLGIRCDVVSIEPAFEALRAGLEPALGQAPFGVTEENLQSRIRGIMLMGVSNRTGSLLLSTGNKSEMAVGYCTLYGDMCGGLAVISDIYKTDVYRVSEWLAKTRGVVPLACLTKPPSAELRPNQTDQDSLPPYAVLDAILELHLEHECGVRDIVAKGFDEGTVRRVLRMVASNEFKRHQAPPGLRVSRKAFGQGRRMPIAASGLEWLDGEGRQAGASR